MTRFFYSTIILFLASYSGSSLAYFCTDSSALKLANNNPTFFVRTSEGRAYVVRNTWSADSVERTPIMDSTGNILENIVSIYDFTVNSGSYTSFLTDVQGKAWWVRHDGIARPINDHSGDQIQGIASFSGYVLLQDGTVWSASNIYTPPVTLSPVTLADGTPFNNIRQLSRSVRSIGQGSMGSHHLALDKNGEIWAWGDNTYGQLGNGTTESNVLLSNKVLVLKENGEPLQSIKKVFTSRYMSAAIDTSGRAWTWGKRVDYTGLTYDSRQTTAVPYATALEKNNGEVFTGIVDISMNSRGGFALIDETGYVYVTSELAGPRVSDGPFTLYLDDEQTGYPYPAQLLDSTGQPANNIIGALAFRSSIALLDRSGTIIQSQVSSNSQRQSLNPITRVEANSCTAAQAPLNVQDPIPHPRLSLLPWPADTNDENRNLIVLTHGYNSDVDSWVNDMALAICLSMHRNGDEVGIFQGSPRKDMATLRCSTGNTDIVLLDWRTKANATQWTSGIRTPLQAYYNAGAVGRIYAASLPFEGYTHIHFLAHSAGSKVIDTIASEIRESRGESVTIHQTFFDAYDPLSKTARNLLDRDGDNPKGLGVFAYGRYANWVDNYYDTNKIAPFLEESGLDNTKNLSTSGMSINVTARNSNSENNAVDNHAWPYRFYIDSIPDADLKPLSENVGFALSKTARQYSGHLTPHPKLHRAKSTIMDMYNCVLGSDESIADQCALNDGKKWATQAVFDAYQKNSSASVTHSESGGNGSFDVTVSDDTQEIDSIEIQLLQSAAPQESLTISPISTNQSQQDTFVWGEVESIAKQRVNHMTATVSFTAGTKGLFSLYINDVIIDQFYQDASVSFETIELSSELPTSIDDGQTITVGVRIDGQDGQGSSAQVSSLQFHNTMDVVGKVLKNNAWAQLSFPKIPRTGLSVYEVLADELPAEGYGQEWIVYRYNPDTNQYSDVGLYGQLSHGEGYWVIQATGSDITVFMPNNLAEVSVIQSAACASALCAPIDAQITQHDITWNMVGYPFSSAQESQTIRVTFPVDSCTNGCTLSDAQNQGLMGSPLWHYDTDTGKYINLASGDNDHFDAWDGFWTALLPNENNRTAQLLIPNR